MESSSRGATAFAAITPSLGYENLEPLTLSRIILVSLVLKRVPWNMLGSA